MSRYEQVTVSPPTPRPAEREYLHTLQAGAWLPFLQASITGVIIGLCVAGLAYALRARHPLTPGLVAGLLAWAATWLWLQRHWYTLTLEAIVNRDLDGDGVIGVRQEPPEPPEVRVRVSMVKENGHYQESIYHLPATLEQMRALAEGLLVSGVPFTERRWTGPGKPFSTGEFRALRAELIKRGLIMPASEKDARQGFVLTQVGEQVLRGFLLEEPPSPTTSYQP